MSFDYCKEKGGGGLARRYPVRSCSSLLCLFLSESGGAFLVFFFGRKGGREGVFFLRHTHNTRVGVVVLHGVS